MARGRVSPHSELARVSRAGVGRRRRRLHPPRPDEAEFLVFVWGPEQVWGHPAAPCFSALSQQTGQPPPCRSYSDACSGVAKVLDEGRPTRFQGRCRAGARAGAGGEEDFAAPTPLDPTTMTSVGDLSLFGGGGPPPKLGGHIAESLRELLGAFRSPPASAHALPFPGLWAPHLPFPRWWLSEPRMSPALPGAHTINHPRDTEESWAVCALPRWHHSPAAPPWPFTEHSFGPPLAETRRAEPSSLTKEGPLESSPPFFWGPHSRLTQSKMVGVA